MSHQRVHRSRVWVRIRATIGVLCHVGVSAGTSVQGNSPTGQTYLSRGDIPVKHPRSRQMSSQAHMDMLGGCPPPGWTTQVNAPDIRT